LFLPSTTTTPTELSTLSLHDALPISLRRLQRAHHAGRVRLLSFRVLACHGRARAQGPDDQPAHLVLGQLQDRARRAAARAALRRSEEHTSELQSRENLVCRLLLEKKK